ncbi:MAG: D-alanyl-D-alanine carboxypeptidase [Solirubrobacterales bacterium]|nr:D-alanyl-D-alanine carboxypeptidase [Solirubrobacterales bacterium]
MRVAPIILAVLLAWVAVAGVAHAQSGPGRPDVRARSAIVMEASTGHVAFRRKIRVERPIASTTKLMTALVALERSDLDDVLSATDYDALAIESQIGLREGERMSVRDLLRALLLESANDAAVTLAVGTMGSRQAFVREMNRRAQQLSLDHTSFANPVGLDEAGNHSSAEDLVRLAVILRRNDFFRETVDLPRATLRTGARRRTVVNRNALVRREGFVDGVKTGRTNQAGYVLVGSATRDGVTVVSAVLGSPTESARDQDTLALLRYGLSRYRTSTPLPEGRVMGEIDLRYRDGETVEVIAGRTVNRVVRRGERAGVTVTGVPEEVDGPLPRGSRVGTAIVRHRDEVIARVPLVTARAVAEAGLGTRLDDLVRRPLTVIALCLLLACSLPLVILRRRAMRRREAQDAERTGTPSREETPVA